MDEDDLELQLISSQLHLEDNIIRMNIIGPGQDGGLTESTNSATHFANSRTLQH